MAGRAVVALFGGAFIALCMARPMVFVWFCLSLAGLWVLGGVVRWIITGEELQL